MKANRKTSSRCFAFCTAVAALATALTATAQVDRDDVRDPANGVDLATSLRLQVFALTADQRLLTFKVAIPNVLRTIGTVSNLDPADATLVGMDFRVQDGKLYGVGRAGGIYTIDTQTAVATKVSQINNGVALDPVATNFGVDFNPDADRLRIVSNQGQNLSHNVNVGGTTTQQGALNRAGTTATGVSGAAYTNNLVDGAPNTGLGTTLFDIDTLNDVVAVQSPPGTGNLQNVGPLGVNAGAAIGLDIYTTLRNGKAVRNTGFASIPVGTTVGFYYVNLLTGKATLLGNLNDSVVDIALPLNQ